MSIRSTALLAPMAVFMACSDPVAPESVRPGSSPTACRDLRALALTDTTIRIAESVPAGGFVPPKEVTLAPPVSYDHLPAFCRVAATISPVPDSAINFEVWMPAAGWNGKFVGTGNGGFSGEIFYFAMSDPLLRGYAVANTDTGHEGDSADASFAVGHPEKLIDFAWRAVHEMTVKSKAIVAAHYGTPARASYWIGCSSGGRQGLKEAQRFPQDYAAISAGAPANNWVPLMAHAAMLQQRLTDPEGGVTREKLLLLREAALAVCDAKDGVADRVIDEPDACPFGARELQCAGDDASDCLTSREVEAALAVYGGVVNPRTGTQIFPGPEVASELEWFAFTPGQFPIGENYWRDLVFGDPSWDVFALDFDADIARALALDAAGLTTTDADLSEFVAAGGKLLLWHGWTDGMISPQNTIDYYNDVLATVGADAVGNSVRLFMVPGMDHCFGGEGTFLVDHLGVLDAWVEQDRAPGRIIARRPLEGGGERTRPLCAHPEVARYTGTGSTDDADSFECGAGYAARPDL